MARLTEEDIVRAVDDVVAICSEHEGAELADKLAVFGVNVDSLADVIAERWVEHASDFAEEDPRVAFIAGATEFFLAGMKARRESERVG